MSPYRNQLEATRPEHLKTNFDGVIFEELGVAGVVVRNSSGEVLAAMSNPSAIDHSCSRNFGSSTGSKFSSKTRLAQLDL